MSVRVETTCRAITAYGGAELLRRTAEVVGLAGAIEAYVSVKHRARGLSEAQFVTGVAESIALGARCLDDLAVARGDGAQEQLRGFGVPAPQTAGTWLRRFTLGHLCQLNKALAQVQRDAFRAARRDGRHLGLRLEGNVNGRRGHLCQGRRVECGCQRR